MDQSWPTVHMSKQSAIKDKRINKEVMPGGQERKLNEKLRLVKKGEQCRDLCCWNRACTTNKIT